MMASSSSSEDRMKIIELKQQAKWAQNLEDMKKAVRELANNYGEKAIPVLDEILYVTAYQEVRSACGEAIRRIRGGGGGTQEEPRRQQQLPATATSAEKSVPAQKEGEGGQQQEKDRCPRSRGCRRPDRRPVQGHGRAGVQHGNQAAQHRSNSVRAGIYRDTGAIAGSSLVGSKARL